MCNADGGGLRNLLFWQNQLSIQIVSANCIRKGLKLFFPMQLCSEFDYSLERMSIGCLLDGLQNDLVHSE